MQGIDTYIHNACDGWQAMCRNRKSPMQGIDTIMVDVLIACPVVLVEIGKARCRALTQFPVGK